MGSNTAKADSLGVSEDMSGNVGFATRCLAIISGLLPYTSSLLMLAYTIANLLYAQGILLVIAIDTGMACTTTCLGLGTRYLRLHLTMRRSDMSGRHKLEWVLALAGPSLVVVIGVTLYGLAVANV